MMQEPPADPPNDVPAPDLVAAADNIEIATNVVGKAIRCLAASGGPDQNQVLAYDVAHSAAQVAAAKAMLDRTLVRRVIARAKAQGRHEAD